MVAGGVHAYTHQYMHAGMGQAAVGGMPYVYIHSPVCRHGPGGIRCAHQYAAGGIRCAHQYAGMGLVLVVLGVLTSMQAWA